MNREKITFLIILLSLFGCKKSDNQETHKNKNNDTIKTNISNAEDNNMTTTNQTIEFSNLFNESSLIKFSPKEVETANTVELNEFKDKLRLFEKTHPTIKDFKIENLNSLVNNETFTNSDYFINSGWLNYFIDKYKIYNLNEVMNLAIVQEDFDAVKIIFKTGYIISKEELKLAAEMRKKSIINSNLNKDKNGIDERGDPLFYDYKKSKAYEIDALFIKNYNYKIFDKDGYTNLRDDSFKEAFVIGIIKSGEYIDIIDNTNQEWLYIMTKDNREGYVHKSRIKYE